LTSARRVNASKSFLSEIIWTDMEPMKRKITMKKVAGFHSLDLLFLPFSPGRRNFGTMDFQNAGRATLGTTALAECAARAVVVMARRAVGARSALLSGRRIIGEALGWCARKLAIKKWCWKWKPKWKPKCEEEWMYCLPGPSFFLQSVIDSSRGLNKDMRSLLP